jgi:hypothetical protein
MDRVIILGRGGAGKSTTAGARRALRRSRENEDFWWWVLTWRWASGRRLLRAIAECATHADLQIMRTPRDLDRFLKGFATR